MARLTRLLFLLGGLILLSTACRPVATPVIGYDPEALLFSGDRALSLESDFVTRFPDRDSGQPNNRRAAEWLRDSLGQLGWDCALDEWSVVNYSRPMPLNNVVCRLPGTGMEEILLVAHHDQSPATVQGADNDGSGIAILLHLAEIFAAEAPGRYGLVFLASDGEEYGMLGTNRFIATHPAPDTVVAAISIDNVGKYFYDNLDMSPIGQFRGYGPLWLQRLVQESARAAGDLWLPPIRGPLDQALDQAVPVSFMDQGPLVAYGVPALGFAGRTPAEFAERHWESYHSQLDTLALQSAATLYQVGRITEATIRQLQSMPRMPRESGPYLYFAGADRRLGGATLGLISAALVALFLVSSFAVVQGRPGGWTRAIRAAGPHFLSLWLPLGLAVLLLYLLVAVGLMDRYALYPATARDPALTSPRWPAVGLFLVALLVMLLLGQRLAGAGRRARSPIPYRSIRALAYAVIGLAGLYILLANPLSLLLLVPLLSWFFMRGRRGPGLVLEILLFLLGGALILALFYVFGFTILRIDLAILWYLLMMFASGMISFASALAITAIVAAGLALLLAPGRTTGD